MCVTLLTSLQTFYCFLNGGGSRGVLYQRDDGGPGGGAGCPWISCRHFGGCRCLRGAEAEFGVVFDLLCTLSTKHPENWRYMRQIREFLDLQKPAGINVGAENQTDSESWTEADQTVTELQLAQAWTAELQHRHKKPYMVSTPAVVSTSSLINSIINVVPAHH